MIDEAISHTEGAGRCVCGPAQIHIHRIDSLRWIRRVDVRDMHVIDGRPRAVDYSEPDVMAGVEDLSTLILTVDCEFREGDTVGAILKGDNAVNGGSDVVGRGSSKSCWRFDDHASFRLTYESEIVLAVDENLLLVSSIRY